MWTCFPRQSTSCASLFVVHRISLLLLDDGEATELASTINRIGPVLARHDATFGEVRRFPVRGTHASIVGEAMRGELPALVRVEGSVARAAVHRAIEVFDATVLDAPGQEIPGWYLVVSNRSDGEESRIEGVRSALDAAIVTPGYASLPARTVSELGHRGLILSVAESCTGGMLGEQITSIAGSSSVFWGSLVTYSYDAKSVVLGVSPDTLEKHGAVSEEVVREMVAGVRRISGSDIAVAISGIAGPGGGTEEKPVGTVWIACETSGSAATARLLRLDGGRDRVRQDAVWECLCLVRSALMSDG